MATTAPQLAFGRLATLSYDECVRRLGWETIGRVASVEPGQAPSVYPVNYAWHEGAVVFRTTERRAEHLQTCPVSFEVDRVDQFLKTGWSVLARGRVVVGDDSPFGGAPVTWAPDQRVVTVRLVPETMSGREIFVGRGPASGTLVLRDKG